MDKATEDLIQRDEKPRYYESLAPREPSIELDVVTESESCKKECQFSMKEGLFTAATVAAASASGSSAIVSCTEATATAFSLLSAAYIKLGQKEVLGFENILFCL